MLLFHNSKQDFLHFPEDIKTRQFLLDIRNQLLECDGGLGTSPKSLCIVEWATL